MPLETTLFEIETGFWLEGAGYFRRHLDPRCLLVFPQSGEMHGIFDREAVAATATGDNRWRRLKMTDRHLLQPTADVALISYRADVLRADGTPYAALVTSGYVQRPEGWKLASHQHAPLAAVAA